MGTGEESTAAKPAAPTASTQETPPLATYPDWTTQMQAYYGAAPPPPFYTSNVASPAPHPYVWGGQHLMPPYGTPIPYPGLYPHGGPYPYPGVPPPAPDAVKEIEGKGADRKERGSTKKSKGNPSLVVGKSGESAKVTSGSGNDGGSQSADSGSEGASESSNENTNQREVSGTKNKSFNQMLAEAGANAQNNDTVGYSGAVVPAPVPGNPVGTIPGTNLNMGMDLWNTSSVGTIPLRAATVPSKMVGREVVPADHVWVQDERELKRQKRKQSNRESARRSRLRKQAECEELQAKVETLNSENHSLSDQLQRLSEQCEKLATENKTLMEELNQLYGPDAVAALQGVSTNMLVQSVNGDGKGEDALTQNDVASGHPNGSFNPNSSELDSK